MERIRHFNWVQFLAMVALLAIGIVTIRSAGCARSQQAFHDVWKVTLQTAVFGMILFFAMAAVDYRHVLRFLSVPAYVFSLLTLVLVLLLGSTIYGGRRWLWFFQPSEVAKIGVILMIAACFGRRGEAAPGWMRRLGFGGGGFRDFMLAVALAGVPCALILAEPDLGTALTLVPAVIVMLLAARVWLKGLLILVATLAIAAMAVLGAVYEAEKPGVSPARRELILKYLPLRSHQVKRIKVFLFPEEDVKGAGYNLRQSLIAIGSGGMLGKGIGKGETNRFKYLPQSISMNDFIFCVYAEETGFVGTMVLLALFGALLVPICRTAAVATEGSGRLLSLGLGTMLFAHVYVNIAMSVGLMPITGLPLPLISSGRTFLVTVLCGLGLIQSVSIHRKENRT